MGKRADGVPTSQLERCERCRAPLIRNPEQPLLCGGCAPESERALAVRKVLAALHAERGTLSDLPALRRVVGTRTC
jgi:hypothetical protein